MGSRHRGPARAFSLAFLLAAVFSPSWAPAIPIGDTLTVIQKPLVNIPALLTPGDTLRVECEAAPSTTGWAVWLERGALDVPLAVLSSAYDASTEWWTIRARVPAEVPLYELYDLWVSANGGILDRTWQAVAVIPEFKSSYYFIQFTDTHMPTNLYNYESGASTDSSEVMDYRAVVADVNLIHPEFVLFTGDAINEGELEDYLGWRVYTRTQMLLTESDVPVFLTAGNHDIGGWDSTPPPDGTARRDWWRFFGWKRLNDPPAGAPAYTQDYSFDYGPVHYTGMEAYNNYDYWRPAIYGSDSFRTAQITWLAADLAAAAGSAARVLFYHLDFQDQVNLTALDVDLALAGHVHYDSGNINAHPCDLTTNNVSNGERAYRVIRVSNGVLQPTATVSAGSTGQNLRVAYAPANNGTNLEVTATITNQLALRFENGRVKFLMPKGGANPTVTGGTLEQVDDSGATDVYYVQVDILANTTQSVTLTLQTVSAVASDGSLRTPGLSLGPAQPNPFNPATRLSFTLPEPGPVRLSVFDVRGREVAVLVDGPQTAGEHQAEWDGRDSRGAPSASGVYLVRLNCEGRTLTRKMILAR